MKEHTQPTWIINSDHPDVLAFAKTHSGDFNRPEKQAVALYYAVRDKIQYDPYTLNLSAHQLRASATLKRGRAWCVPKAALLAACCRAMGIAARVGFADVKNHLSTQKMRETMTTDIFYWHGYASLFLNGNWVKATPAFNIELCERFQLKPLEFDGKNDSLFHSFDLEGKQHMEYVNDRGDYSDVPLDEIRATFSLHYPGVSQWQEETNDFDADVERETESNDAGS